MNITLGEVFDTIIKIAAVAAAIGALYGLLMKGIKKLIIPMRIKSLKSDLTTLFYLAENGNLSNEQKMLAHEEYDEYHEIYKQNSYIHDAFEKLRNEGKI